MKKRLIKKYHLKQEIKEAIILSIFIILVVLLVGIVEAM